MAAATTTTVTTAPPKVGCKWGFIKGAPDTPMSYFITIHQLIINEDWIHGDSTSRVSSNGIEAKIDFTKMEVQMGPDTYKLVGVPDVNMPIGLSFVTNQYITTANQADHDALVANMKAAPQMPATVAPATVAAT